MKSPRRMNDLLSVNHVLLFLKPKNVLNNKHNSRAYTCQSLFRRREKTFRNVFVGGKYLIEISSGFLKYINNSYSDSITGTLVNPFSTFTITCPYGIDE